MSTAASSYSGSAAPPGPPAPRWRHRDARLDRDLGLELLLEPRRAVVHVPHQLREEGAREGATGVCVCVNDARESLNPPPSAASSPTPRPIFPGATESHAPVSRAPAATAAGCCGARRGARRSARTRTDCRPRASRREHPLQAAGDGAVPLMLSSSPRIRSASRRGVKGSQPRRAARTPRALAQLSRSLSSPVRGPPRARRARRARAARVEGVAAGLAHGHVLKLTAEQPLQQSRVARARARAAPRARARARARVEGLLEPRHEQLRELPRVLLLSRLRARASGLRAAGGGGGGGGGAARARAPSGGGSRRASSRSMRVSSERSHAARRPPCMWPKDALERLRQLDGERVRVERRGRRRFDPREDSCERFRAPGARRAREAAPVRRPSSHPRAERDCGRASA